MKTNQEENNIFWPSFTDLMTSLFFVMLVTAVVLIASIKKRYGEDKDIAKTVTDLLETSDIEEIKDYLGAMKQNQKTLEAVDQSLSPLKESNDIFRYEEEYKRFKLGFEVKFKSGQYTISSSDLYRWNQTKRKIDKAGRDLKAFIDGFVQQKDNAEDGELDDVSYMIVISGYASHEPDFSQWRHYELSYKRAYELWAYWKKEGIIDFEDERYAGAVEVHVAGNGFGGIGRFNPNCPPEGEERDSPNWPEEEKNQRFLIEVVPKLGDLSK